jgi:predicted Rossmann fold nucleotide-binding protein DprA/Smf involved in DNA uptake
VRESRLRIAFGGLHPDRIRGLFAENGARETLRRLESGDIRTTERVRQALAVPGDVRLAELARSGIDVVWRGESGYPEVLAMLPDAPDLLFVRGSIPQVPAVAVVGTRRCTSYGRRIAEGYGRAIAAAGWPVVSGLARGIDGAAHGELWTQGGWE